MRRLGQRFPQLIPGSDAIDVEIFLPVPAFVYQVSYRISQIDY
jgi:hypothetical protein